MNVTIDIPERLYNAMAEYARENDIESVERLMIDAASDKVYLNKYGDLNKKLSHGVTSAEGKETTETKKPKTTRKAVAKKETEAENTVEIPRKTMETAIIEKKTVEKTEIKETAEPTPKRKVTRRTLKAK